MSDTRWTRGPWRSRIGSVSFADGVFAGDVWIANLDCGTDGDERDANARLISAAPEMAEELLNVYCYAPLSATKKAKIEALLKKAGLL